MAKNYKRHSQGIGFRRSDFGDLGLRAYKEQQDRIINSLKLQNQQFESTRKEFIDSDILKSAKELENSKEIKKFQDKVWDVKFENKKKRADQEIRNLELQAKEKEQQSKFWLDFSTTYSQQYAEAATKIHGAIDLKRAQTFIDDYYTKFAVDKKEFSIPLLGEHQAYNATLAIRASSIFIERARSKLFF